MNASADVDCSSDVVGQGGEGELGGDLFLALAEEIAAVVVVLDGAEGMLAGLLAELLFGDVALNEDHDALVVAPELSEVVVVVGLGNVGNLLKGIAGVGVHDDGNVGAVPADVDVLLSPGIGAAIGAGAAGFATGILGAVFGIPLFEQLPSHGTGHSAVLVADEAADIAEGLNLDADVGAFVAVRQHAGVEASLDILRLRGGFYLRGDVLLRIVQRKHALFLVLDKAHVRHNAVHEAIPDIRCALIALVGDDLHGFQLQVLHTHLHAAAQLPLVAGCVGDVEVGDHVAFGVHGGLDVVAGLDAALLRGHHGGFRVGKGQRVAARFLQLLQALFVEGDALLQGLHVGQVVLVQVQGEGMVDPPLTEVILVHGIQILFHGSQLGPGVFQLLAAELGAGGLLPAVDGADGGAVQAQRLGVHELHLFARPGEDEEYLLQQLPVRLSEIRDGAKVRAEPVDEEPQLDVPPALPHEPPGGTYPVQIAPDIQLHQVVGIVGWPARGRGDGVLEPHGLQIQAVHKNFDESRGAVLRHLVLDTPHAQGHLPAVRADDIAHAIASRSTSLKQWIDESSFYIYNST